MAVDEGGIPSFRILQPVPAKRQTAGGVAEGAAGQDQIAGPGPGPEADLLFRHLTQQGDGKHQNIDAFYRIPS